MLSLLFGGALSHGGFAVYGLALIALIALLSGRIGGSGLQRSSARRIGGIELLYQSPSPDVVSIGSGTVGRVGHCTKCRRGRRDGLEPISGASDAVDGRVETNSGCISINGL